MKRRNILVSPLRHLEVFSPQAFGQQRVDVIGVGATGSRIALSLAKLGIKNLHVWDFDRIEDQNIANQAYGCEDVGKLKVDALKDLIKDQTGVSITAHNEQVDGSQDLGEVVFLLIDSMDARREIWEKGMKFKLKTRLLIETRMGVDTGRIYALNPNLLSHIRGWEATLYTSEDAQASACGASTSVGPTAEIISGLAVWQMIRWFTVEQGKDEQLENEVIFSLRPLTFLSRSF